MTVTKNSYIKQKHKVKKKKYNTEFIILLVSFKLSYTIYVTPSSSCQNTILKISITLFSVIFISVRVMVVQSHHVKSPEF